MRTLLGIAVSMMVSMQAMAGVTTGKDAVAEIRSAYPDLSPGMVDELSSRAEIVYMRLSRFFDRDIRRPIIIDLSDRYPLSTAFPNRNMIGLPRHVIERGIVPLTHEMTHLFMPERHSAMLSEGIAIYTQDRFGMARSFPNFGRDLDEMLAARLVRMGDAAPFSVATAERVIAGYISGRDRRTAYLIAGSFTRYLVDVVIDGDMTIFRRLYLSGDYEAVTGRTLTELEAAWRVHAGYENNSNEL